MGLLFAGFATPYVLKPGMSSGSHVMIFLMLVTIGYAVTGMPARWITKKLKKLILGDRAK